MQKEGKELMAEIGESPSLDEVMRRDPIQLTDDDLLQIIKVEREARALFIKKQEAKAQKREEEEDDGSAEG